MIKYPLILILFLFITNVFSQVKDSIIFVDSITTTQKVYVVNYVHKDSYTKSYCNTGSIYAEFCSIDTTLKSMNLPFVDTLIKRGLICLYVSPYEFGPSFLNENIVMKYFKPYETNLFETKIKKNGKRKSKNWILFNRVIDSNFKFYHYIIEVNYLKRKLKYLKYHSLIPNAGYVHLLVPA
jgi:hypothetical protein